MRTVAVALTLLVLTPLMGLPLILLSLIGVKSGPDGVYATFARIWARCICIAAGARIHLHGYRAPQDGEGVIYCCNHVSWFDILSLAGVLRRYTFISKKELASVPIFGRAAKTVGIVFIDRQNRKSAFASYEKAALEVRAGKSVVVYPEGTRGYEYRLRPFKKGPFVLAIASGAPIVPTVVYGAREMQSKGKMRIRSGTVHIHFLPAIPTAGLTYEDREALMISVWDVMAKFMREQYGIDSSGGALSPDAEAASIRTSFF